MNYSESSFETRLRELRKNRGISAEKLGEYLDLAKGSIYNYEKGRGMPDVQSVVKICQLFGCSADYLLLGKDDKQMETYGKTTHDCAKIIDSLEDFEKEFFFVLLDGMALKRKEILSRSKTANYEGRLLQSMSLAPKQ